MYPAQRIIQINTSIQAAGLANANFATAMLFATDDTLPSGFAVDTFRAYFTLSELALDFPDTTKVYQAASEWLNGTPYIGEIRVWAANPVDATITATLNKARDKTWWYWTFTTEDILSNAADVELVAQWCESNNSMFVNSQTGASATAIRTPATTTDIASRLTALGIRHAYTPTHATDKYSGNYLAKHFAKVNYSGVNTTITGEFKKSPGLLAEDLTATAIVAMESPTKKATFYTIVALDGSVDNGRWLNTFTHSTYGEYIDDVVNLDAFVNSLTVGLYNSLANQPTKLKQIPAGQAVLNGAAKAICEQYVANGYLGPRNYVDPDDGQEKYTVGYEILTKPEDILNISESDRNERKSAAIRIRVFRAGAIHKSIVDVSVF